MLKRLRIVFTVMLVLAAVSVNAQVTTASMGGKVTDTSDEVIIGATVQAIHEPSGTRYGAVTNVDGRYSIQGMRAGGPYKVEISYIGYETVVFTGVSLKLGETTNVSTKIKESAELLGEVLIVGKAGVDATKTGAAMSMNSADLNRMPSISHGISDMVRMNPQVSVAQNGAMSFAGTNNRYNSFQIDGAMNNDVFGLTANGSNGGQAGTQPVSMETIEQIQVNIAPFDVRQSGFTGGAINAVTKSGTNTFHGSAYGFGNNQSLIGRKYKMMNGKTSDKYTDQTEYQAGITIGGPIIKDKLFFFANYEKASQTYPNPYGVGATASRVDGDVANDIMDKIKEMAAQQGVAYNGSYSSEDVYTKSDKAGVKLDWNINSKHNASIRWSLVSAKQLNAASGATSLNSSDYSYDFASKTNTFIAELQSRFTDNISNELRASYVRVRDERQPGAAFPMITINNVGDGTLNLGNERSSMANRLDQDIWSLTNNLTWYQGNHTFTFGTHNEIYSFCNLFIQDYYGSYYYNSPEDFFAGKINRYRHNNTLTAATGNNALWEPSFSAGQLGFYAQDKWNVTDNFDLTYGIRMDIPIFFDKPMENAAFNEFSAAQGWGMKTNQKLSSTPLFSPRVGFRWNIDESNKFVLRGGLGIFTGRIPFVWLSNNFTNTGMTMNTYNTYSCTDLSLILDPNKQIDNASKLTSGTQTINVFADDFKFAQNLRLNVGFDFELAGIDWTAEAIYSKTLNDILYQNLAYEANGNTLGGTIAGMEFDQRPMFSTVAGANAYYGIYALSNTSKGYTYNLSLQGRKSFDFGLDAMASYTFTRSKSVNNGTSSVAASNWNYNYTYNNPNSPELGFSAFNVPHRIQASVYYHKDYAKSWTTTVGLLYTGNSGAPYSIYYNGDLNGDSSNGNDLIFIPTDAQIDAMPFATNDRYTVDAQRANMKAWIANDDYMSKHRGEYFERNADNAPFEHHFDFHFAQKYSFKVGKTLHALELSFDILNVGNMFNKEWGRYTSTGSAQYFSPITYNAKTKNFNFLHDADYNMRSYSDYYSRWRGQIGLKYTF